MHVLLKVKYVCVLTDNFFEMGCINEWTISSWLNKTKEKKTHLSPWLLLLIIQLHSSDYKKIKKIPITLQIINSTPPNKINAIYLKGSCYVFA
jgi:hypothetical protein